MVPSNVPAIKNLHDFFSRLNILLQKSAKYLKYLTYKEIIGHLLSKLQIYSFSKIEKHGKRIFLLI